MIDKIKIRMASEEGFTLIELLVVIIILGILVAIAIPVYLSFAGKAKGAAAQANVRSAVPAAEAFYQDGNIVGHTVNTYDTLSSANLKVEAPGISPNVKAGVGATNQIYCIQDAEPGGSTYNYIGGTGGTAVMAVGPCPAGYTVS